MNIQKSHPDNKLSDTLTKFVWHCLRDHKWCLVGFLWSILFVFVSYFASRKSEILARKNSEDASVLSGTVNDYFTNVISVKLFDNNVGEYNYIN